MREADTHSPDPRLELSVNELLKRRPEAVALLNDLGIDTCCGGSQPLAEAAAEAGLAPAALLEMLCDLDHL